MDERDDPEASYRRGVQQGAHLAVEAAERAGLDGAALAALKDWTGVRLHRWRYLERTQDRRLQPPAPPG